MAGDRPDWRKGTVAHRCTGGACPVSDVQDWNKVVMAYPPGDPQLTKDYEDWVHGTVYEEGSSACLYDCEKLLIHDIGEKTDSFTDEVVKTLTAAQAAFTGILIQIAFSKGGYEGDNTLYITEDVDGHVLLPYIWTKFSSTEEEASKYFSIFSNSLTPTVLIATDPVAPPVATEKDYELYARVYYYPCVLNEGERTFTLDVEFPAGGDPARTLHFLKIYLLYSTGVWLLARFQDKGEGGITW
jgi:hypothetical protein